MKESVGGVRVPYMRSEESSKLKLWTKQTHVERSARPKIQTKAKNQKMQTR
jgi:hypothetical protein